MLYTPQKSVANVLLHQHRYPYNQTPHKLRWGYQESVLPNDCRKRLAVETGHGDYWRKWVGLDGDVLGMAGFGESGPGPDVLEHFGFTAKNIVKRVKELNS